MVLKAQLRAAAATGPVETALLLESSTMPQVASQRTLLEELPPPAEEKEDEEEQAAAAAVAATDCGGGGGGGGSASLANQASEQSAGCSPFQQAAAQESAVLQDAYKAATAADDACFAAAVAELCPAGSSTYTPSVSCADAPRVAPGMLTCPSARLRQHALTRQMSRRTTLPQSDQPSLDPDVPQCPVQQQQVQQQMQALVRCRQARRAALAAAMQQAGQRQLSNARLMRPPSMTAGHTAHQPSTVKPPDCKTMQEARARCLGQLGDYMLMQHMQEMGVPPSCQELTSRSATEPGSASANRTVNGVPVPSPTLAATASAPVGSKGPAAGSAQKPAAGMRYGIPNAAAPATAQAATKDDVAPASFDRSDSAAVAAAAAAAVSSRKLPPVWKQLQTIMLRCFWKSVLCRSGVMTDLMLISILGLALGIAQGRNNDPTMSLLWLLIGLLAYGSVTLIGATRSYGRERHIFLQLDSPVSCVVCLWCVLLYLLVLHQTKYLRS